MAREDKKNTALRTSLFRWNRLENKRIFFWRTRKLNLFQFTIVELLLQKTRAENAENIIKKFVAEYKAPVSVLKESRARLKRMIKPLGLQNQRARAILRIASVFKKEKRPRLEETFGVGHYIYNAVNCFYFNKRVPILDTNTSRIIARLFGLENKTDLRRNKILLKKTEELLPSRNYKKFNWALLDFGATVCKTKPSCGRCPLQKNCTYCKGRKKK